MVNTLADACNMLKNAEYARKKNVVITPASKLLQRILRIFQANAYIGEFERYDDGRQGKFKISLLGKINECKALMRLNYKTSQYTQIFYLKLYTAYFNRAADKAGVDYWLNEMDVNGWSIDDVAATFAQQAEYTDLYEGMTEEKL